MAQRHVVVVAENNINQSRLVWFTISPRDPGTAANMDMLTRSASALGYTTPSIAIADGMSVGLAYTFASPPTVDSDNVYCDQLDLSNNNLMSNVCKPSAANTNGAFVVEATLAETPAETTLFWRSTDIWASVFTGATEHPPMRQTGLSRVVRAVYSGGSLGIVGEKNADGMGPRWVIGPGGRPGGASRALESPDLAPDLIAADSGFLYCARHSDGDQNDGELEVGHLTTNFDTVGTPSIVPRISRADIVNCHLVLGTTTVGVVWQELVPPASARTYLAQLPIP
jgi:hypothetical protein